MYSLKKYVVALFAAFAVSGGVAAAHLDVLNWSDYIAQNTLSNFEKRSGIDVVYDVFDSNEVLEAKLLSGHSGYDLVAPTSEFLARQIKAHAFLEIDKSRLHNWKNLDTGLLQKLQAHDPGNHYAIPYMWGTTGIGYNREKIAEILGEEAPVDSWELVFNPKYLKQLQSHGVAFLDAPTEMFSAALNYLGLDPNSENPEDYARAEKLLKEVSGYVRYFDNARYISDLANGSIVLAVGWSGDIMMAADRSEEAHKPFHIAYTIPKEGAGVWFDMLAIPADADDIDQAYQFIDYLLEPKVIAEISNVTSYANPNREAFRYVDKSIRDNPSIYPTGEASERLYSFHVINRKINRVITSSWNRVKAAHA